MGSGGRDTMDGDDRTASRVRAPEAAIATAAVAALVLSGALGRWDWFPTHRAVILTGMAAAVVFVVAGCYRLARWQLLRDAHSGLAGSALLVVGSVAVPSRSLVEAVTGVSEASLTSATLRGAASLVAMGLLLRALGSPELRGHARPGRLVPLLLLGCGAVFVLTVSLEYAVLDDPTSVGRAALVVLSLAVAGGWAALAVVMERHRDQAPWAGRVSPLLSGMALAELLRAAGGETPGTLQLAALLLTLAIGLLAVRSATADLGHATGTSRAVEAHLVDRLGVAEAELALHEAHRRTLRHESRNTCAGLRAALTVFATPDGGLRPDVVGRLREAAVAELSLLEEMLDPHPTEGSGVDVDAAVADAVAPLRSLGLPVQVVGSAGRAIGSATEVTLVVREALIQGTTRLAGRPVLVALGRDGDHVRVEVRDATGGPLDLRAVGHLLRRPGVDVVTTPDGGALLRLPAAYDAVDPVREGLAVPR